MGFVIWTNIFILVLEKKININNLRLTINITKRKVIYEKTLLSWENSFFDTYEGDVADCLLSGVQQRVMLVRKSVAD